MKRRVFADTFYFIALLAEDDAAHDRVKEFLADFTGEMVTAQYVLAEVGDAFANRNQRGVFVDFLPWLESQAGVTIIPATDELFHRGYNLFARRSDKDWSLTDCTSFVVMEEMGLVEALTGDRHFEQAGIVALFLP